MIKTYEEFSTLLSEHIGIYNEDFVYKLLINVVENPTRYTGIFRTTNAKTKLIQNVTQSQEIKFGDFMENIITEYIACMGYENLPKNIGCDDDGNPLSADQFFKLDNTIYLIEQKIRDDHDSTKKRGQFLNFQKKIHLLRKKYQDKPIKAIMWFIDPSLTKNKNFYIKEASFEIAPLTDVDVKYGGALFSDIFHRIDVWEEICSYLLKNKQERSNDLLQIPDFDTSKDVKLAIQKLKQEQPKLYKKLMSDHPNYVALREELFPTGYTLDI